MSLPPSLDGAQNRDTGSGGDAGDADGAVALDRHAGDGSRGRALVLGPAASARRGPVRCRRWGCSPPALPAVKARPDDLEPRLNCQLAAWLTHGRPGRARSERREPRHRLHTRRLRGRAARSTRRISLAAALQWNEPVNAERQKAVAEKLGRPGARACDVMRDFVEVAGPADPAGATSG